MGAAQARVAVLLMMIAVQAVVMALAIQAKPVLHVYRIVDVVQTKYVALVPVKQLDVIRTLIALMAMIILQTAA